MTAIDRIKPFAEGKDDVHVVIDTPWGSRNKLKWDKKLGVLKLSHVLTAGAVFSFDFGFVPGMHEADGREDEVGEAQHCKPRKEKALS